MRRLSFALAGTLTFLVAQAAFAADMPVKAPVQKAPVAATSWTGFYVNGGLGYGVWAADTHTVFPDGTCDECTNQVQGGKGWLGVVGGGFDYQLTPQIVIGGFGDYNFSSLKGTVQDGNPFFAGDIKQKSAWAAGGRAGWLTTPSVMSYVNAGYTAARFSSAPLVTTFLGAPEPFATPETTMKGWFVGGGIEVALAPSWFLRTEYRYATYDSKDLPEASTIDGSFIRSIYFKPHVQTATAQLVYKVNPFGMAPAFSAAAPPTLMPTKAPPPTPALTNWTGFYVNGGVGYGVWAADTTIVNPATGGCDLCFTQVQGGKGWLGILGGGYDWQFAPAWVVGPFGDYNFSRLKGSIQDQIPVWMGEIKQTAAWAAGARIGWLPTPTLLAYANGGYSGARFSGTTLVFEYAGGPAGVPTGNLTPGFTRNGWFVGGGMETTMPLLGKGWFWRSEYRLAKYGTKSIPDIGASVQDNITFKPTVQTVTSQIVFKFN